MHINVVSEAEAAKWSIQSEGEHTDIKVTAPLAIHNTIYHKKSEPECGQRNAQRQRFKLLKQRAGYIAASLAVGGLFSGMTVFLVYPLLAESEPEKVAVDHCFLDDGAHSVGSITKMTNGEYRECVRFTDQAPHWGAINRDKLH